MLFSTIGSKSDIVGMVVPAPAGTVILLGTSIRGSLFGSKQEEVNPYAKIEEELGVLYDCVGDMEATISNSKGQWAT